MSNSGESQDVRVIQPAGVLCATTSSALLEELEGCLTTRVKYVLMDLQNVDFIDSSGLGTLIAMHTRLRLAGSRLYFCSLKEQARSLFDISDMDQIFDIFSSQSEFYSRVVKPNQAMVAE